MIGDSLTELGASSQKGRIYKEASQRMAKQDVVPDTAEMTLPMEV